MKSLSSFADHTFFFVEKMCGVEMLAGFPPLMWWYTGCTASVRQCGQGSSLWYVVLLLEHLYRVLIESAGWSSR